MKLTDTHLVLLSAAAQHEAGLLPRPDRLRGKAAQLLATGLIRAGFAEEISVHPGQPHWRLDDNDDRPVGLRITREGLAAIGLSETEEPCAGAPADIPEPQSARAPRNGSKQAAVLALLRREEGATLTDLIAATGWLPHTTRAALTGFRKRGYAIAKDRDGDGRTIYHIGTAAASVLSGDEA